MTDIDTAAIRASLDARGTIGPLRTYDLCDALDAARTESEALRREQIHAVRLAEAAEAECVRHATRSEELENALDAVCVEALGYLDRAEAAEARIAAALARCKQGNRGGPYGLQAEITALLTPDTT